MKSKQETDRLTERQDDYKKKINQMRNSSRQIIGILVPFSFFSHTLVWISWASLSFSPPPFQLYVYIYIINNNIKNTTIQGEKCDFRASMQDPLDQKTQSHLLQPSQRVNTQNGKSLKRGRDFKVQIFFLCCWVY